jgi:uncharacterized protein
VSSLYLFGSIARGEDDQASDVDLLVEFSGHPTLFTLGRLQDDLAAVLGRSVDIGTPRSLRAEFAPQVLTERIRVA